MRDVVLPLLAGVLFASGLVVGGMTQPAKVTAFLDFFGAWDPSLILVMIGAVGVYFPGHRWVLGRARQPLFAAKFALPTRRDLDWRLWAGAALFGLGWGLGGYCPGPALVSIGSGAGATLWFVAWMLGGMGLHELWVRLSARSATGK